MINEKLLRSQMALRGVDAKGLADAQKWSMTTVYRKLNGHVSFTAPEIQVCVGLLGLDSKTAGEIFFAGEVS